MLKNKRLKILLLIFLISIIPRILFMASVLKINDGNVSILVHQDDGIRYYTRAAWLAGKLSISRIRHNMLWDVPLYPIFLSIFFKLWQPNYLLAIFLNIILFGLSSCLLYIIGVLLLGDRAGIYAAIIFSLYPILLICSLQTMTEPLFLVLFLSAFYSFISFLRSDRNKYLMLTAFFLGLLTLTKEVMLFFTILIVAFTVLIYTKHWKQAVKTISLLIVVYMAVLSPVIIYNYRTSKHFAISQKMLVCTNSWKRKLRFFVFKKKSIATSNSKGTSLQKKGNLFLNVWDYFYKRKRFFGAAGTKTLMRTLGYNVSELEAVSESPKLFLTALKKKGWGWVIFQYYALFFVGYVYISSFLP